MLFTALIVFKNMIFYWDFPRKYFFQKILRILIQNNTFQLIKLIATNKEYCTLFIP